MSDTGDAAAPDAGLAQLLVLQDLDIRIEQLEHRKASLPERAELAKVDSALGALAKHRAEVQAKRDAAARDQKRREDEVAALDTKIAEVDRALYAGGVTSPREAQTLTEELEALRRRRSSIEDEIIEIMEYAEPLDAELTDDAGKQDAFDAEATRLLAAIAEAEASIDAELEGALAERDSAAIAVGVEVLARYEELRRSLGGIAVARLERNTCGGCHLSLPAAEIDRLKRLPANEPVYCEDCGRLLVR